MLFILLMNTTCATENSKEKLLAEKSCVRGYVDSIITVNNRQFHLLNRVYVEDTSGKFPNRTMTILAETKDDPKAYQSVVDFVQAKTKITYRPDNVILYTTDSALHTIASGDYSSVVGISYYYTKNKKVTHHGYVLQGNKFADLGNQKLVLENVSRITLWDFIHFYKMVHKDHEGATAYFLISSINNFQ